MVDHSQDGQLNSGLYSPSGGYLGDVDAYVDQASTTSTSLVQLLTYSPPPNSNGKILEISLAPDSVFITKGKIQLKINGNFKFRDANPNSATFNQTSPKQLTNTVTIDYRPTGFYLAQGGSIEVWALSTDGSTVTIGFEVSALLEPTK